MNDYLYIERNPTVEEYLAVRKSVTLDVPRNDVVEIAMKNTLFAVCALWQEQVIGYGRVIGDGGIYVYIQDVFVMPDHQRKGVGRKIVNVIMNYFRSNLPNNAFIGLMSAEGAKGFYEKFGFHIRPDSRPGMFKIWTEAENL